VITEEHQSDGASQHQESEITWGGSIRRRAR